MFIHSFIHSHVPQILSVSYLPGSLLDIWTISVNKTLNLPYDQSYGEDIAAVNLLSLLFAFKELDFEVERTLSVLPFMLLHNEVRQIIK